MKLLLELRDAIRHGRCPPIFKPSDLVSAGITDGGRNLSNYDKKNGGTDHEKALVSRKIDGDVYYCFDEQVFQKLPPRSTLKCEDNNEGIRCYSNPSEK